MDLGEYPLSFASSLGKTDVLRLLIDAGGILDAVDSRGRCALHMAVVSSWIALHMLRYDCGECSNSVFFCAMRVRRRPAAG